MNVLALVVRNDPQCRPEWCAGVTATVEAFQRTALLRFNNSYIGRFDDLVDLFERCVNPALPSIDECSSRNKISVLGCILERFSKIGQHGLTSVVTDGVEEGEDP